MSYPSYVNPYPANIFCLLLRRLANIDPDETMQNTYNHMWASTQENLSSGACEQQRAQTSLRIRAV